MAMAVKSEQGSPGGSSGKVRFRHLDAQGKADRLQLRAREIKLKTQKAAIVAIMDAHPDAVPQITEYLQSLGYSSPSTLVQNASAVNRGSSDDLGDEPAAGVKQEGGAEEPGEGSSAAGDAEGMGEHGRLSRVRPSCGIVDECAENWVCHKYVNFTTSSVVFMVDVLSAIEPISMSKVALRPASCRGKKETKMQNLAELLEFSTGVSRETRLVGKLRHIPTLKDWLRQQSVAEGRRARDLAIPAQWSAHRDGVYRFVQQADTVWIEDKVSLVKHVIPAEDVLKYRDGSPIPLDHLQINLNYSAEKAVVASTRSTDTLQIITLGDFGRKGTRLAKMQLNLAVDDGETMEPGFKKAKAEVPEAAEQQQEQAKVGEAGCEQRAQEDVGQSEAAWAPPVPVLLAGGAADEGDLVGTPPPTDEEASGAHWDEEFAKALAAATGVKDEVDALA